MTPEGIDADAVRKIIYERFDCSLGTGLGKIKGKMFRIGHLGDCNDLTLMAALAGCEMGLKLAGVKLAGFMFAFVKPDASGYLSVSGVHTCTCASMNESLPSVAQLAS